MALSFLLIVSVLLSFCSVVYYPINWFMINLVFVLMMLLNEPRKFTFHSSSRKNTKRLQTSLKCCLSFWASQTINSVFHQVVLTTSSYTEVGYQIDFSVRG